MLKVSDNAAAKAATFLAEQGKEMPIRIVFAGLG